MAGKSFIANGQIGIGTQTTTERNAGVSTATGTTIYNSTDNIVQVWSGTAWDTLSNVFSATGGTEIIPGNGYKYHTFTSSGTFEVASGSATAEFFAVGPGGGGAGGNGSSGGGGGGGIVYLTGYTLIAGIYTITIPGGGAAGASANVNGTTGGDATVTHPEPFSLTAKGGGGGGAWTQPGGLPGGSGGGAGGPNSRPGGSGIQPSQTQTHGSGSVTQYGNNGGASNPPPGHRGGGGGGAGGVGGAGLNDNTGGTGGPGQPFPAFNGPLIGEPTLGPNWAGGGGGGSEVGGSPSPAAGGAGGGGPSGGSSPVNGTPGTANSGGGGGAGWWPPTSNPGGNGGKGIVVIRYPV